MHDYLEVCEQAARAGGRVLLEWQGRFEVREKGPKDLVTEADLASQRAIQEVVLRAFPDHGFFGEETWEADSAVARPGETAYRWVVDPLDGTVNYVHGLPRFAVSVALEHDGDVLAGVVYDPLNGECYSASAGRGAWLNGSRLAASRCVRLSESLVAASFAASVSRDSPEIRRFVDVLLECQSLRRLGSAALNLCYVAAGRLDGYFASSVKTWDVAAGALLVREAGGCLSGIDGSAFQLQEPRLVAAGTEKLRAQLLAVLNRSERT